MGGKKVKKVAAATVNVPVEDQISPEASSEFVYTPYVQELTDRALAYLEVGYPVHFAGAAGTGKTTLAFHVAAQLRRPVTLIHGDDEFGSSDLVGRHAGYRKQKLIDNFIHSVLKTEESLKVLWMDNRLTTACKEGYTLIYDEFTRSRPEANNALLSILEEKILNLPNMSRNGGGYLEVHPEFRAIFTSNPEEYAGVYKSQDALRDRMVTIELGNFDEATEVAITQAKSGLSLKDSRHIVSLVRKVRQAKSKSQLTPTVRGCIVLGKILNLKGRAALYANNGFRQICFDVLMTGVSGQDRKKVSQVIDEFLAAPLQVEASYV